jgi:hypothetical protein
MRTWSRNHKRKYKPNVWDMNDSPLMHDEMRVLFGESAYLLEYLHMASFKDIFNGRGSTPTGMALEDSDFAQQYPMLYIMLSKTEDDDGKPRQVCTLTLVCEDGQAKCGINERNYGLSLWRSSGSILGVFAELEEALGERPVDWRKVQWKGRGAKP